MQKRIPSIRVLLIAFVVFIISCTIAGITSSQFTSIQSALTVATPTTIGTKQVQAVGVPSPTVSPIRTITPQATPPTPTLTLLLTRDIFNRQNQAFWGQMTSGEIWQGDATRSRAFAVVDDSGHVTGQGPYYAFTPPALQDVEVRLTSSASDFQGTTFGVIFRWIDQNNWYNAFLDGEHLVVQKKVRGVLSTLAIAPFVTTVGTLYSLSLWAVNATFYVKAWPAGSSEPSNWNLATHDTSLQSGYCGVYTYIQQKGLVTVKEYSVTGLSYT